MLFGVLLSGMGNSSMAESSACTRQTEKADMAVRFRLTHLTGHPIIGKLI